MTKPRIYIAGPMTGIEDFNFPAFHAAAAAWREAGWAVSNPAEEFNGAQDLPYGTYVQQDLLRLAGCNALAVLPGWDGPNARGSVWERYVAEQVFHLPIYDATDPCAVTMGVTVGQAHKPVESCLEEAQRIVHGARQQAYGHPLDDFSKTATLWGVVLKTDVTAEQVALCMIAVKMSRLLNAPDHHDSIVDIAGYTATYEMVQEERKRRASK